jgi:hypothetical protein
MSEDGSQPAFLKLEDTVTALCNVGGCSLGGVLTGVLYGGSAWLGYHRGGARGYADT